MFFKSWARAYQNHRRRAKQVRCWQRNGYTMPAPHAVKEAVLTRYCTPDVTWVETGTYIGTTTRFLSGLSDHVYTIEPQRDFYAAAKLNFSGCNVTPILGTSEDVLPVLLPKLHGAVNFWLDGHYSGGDTFQGSNECPILNELSDIAKNIKNFAKISIFIDDVRCFHDETRYPSYPSVYELIEWARKNDFRWIIEHDILVMNRNTP